MAGAIVCCQFLIFILPCVAVFWLIVAFVGPWCDALLALLAPVHAGALFQVVGPLQGGPRNCSSLQGDAAVAGR